MKIIVKKDKDEASKIAAEMIKELLVSKESPTLGLATGSTPITLYQQLIEMNKKNEISFRNVKTVNLDEYIGLDGSHPQSYRFFMNENLFNHVDIDKSNTHVPNGNPSSLDEEAKNYEKIIDSLGHIDIQILGVGPNGHIGFNEPNTHLQLYTHVEDLTQTTIEANSRFFDSIDQVPKKAISMGIGSIFKAKKIIVLAFGKNKADAIKDLSHDEISTNLPVSILKLHPDVTLILDEDAASLL